MSAQKMPPQPRQQTPRLNDVAHGRGRQRATQETLDVRLKVVPDRRSGTPEPSTPEAFAKFVGFESARWRKLFLERNISTE